MKKFILTTSSTADVSRDYLAEHELPFVSYSYMFKDDEKICPDDCWESISAKDYYEKLRNVQSTTSLVPETTYDEFFREQLKQGMDVLHLEMSSGISGSCFNAKRAAEAINEEGGANRVYVVDTLCISSGLGLLVDYAVNMRDAGKELQEVLEWVEENKLFFHHWFTVDDLDFLYRGGRLSKATAVVGSMLKIKPLLNVNNEGRLINLFKIRGRKKVIATLVEKMKEDIANPDGQSVFICQGDCMEDAEYLKKLVLEAFPTVKEVKIFYTGPVIVAHSGPGTLALFYKGRGRYEQ